jgi:hypothetical protein
VFLDFREVRSDAEHPWAQAAQELEGRGAPSLDEVLREIQLRPVVAPFRELVNAGVLRQLAETRAFPGEVEPIQARLAHGVRVLIGGSGDEGAAVQETLGRLKALGGLADRLPAGEDTAAWGVLLGWLVIAPLERVQGGEKVGLPGRDWIRAFRWDRVLLEAFSGLGVEPSRAGEAVLMVEALLAYSGRFRARALEGRGAGGLLEAWLSDDLVRRLLGVNEFQGVWWLAKEPWEALVAALATVSAVEAAADTGLAPVAREKQIRACLEVAAGMREAARAAGYRVDRLMAGMTEGARGPAKGTPATTGRARPASKRKSTTPPGRKRSRRPDGDRPR